MTKEYCKNCDCDECQLQKDIQELLEDMFNDLWAHFDSHCRITYNPSVKDTYPEESKEWYDKYRSRILPNPVEEKKDV